MNDMRKLMEMVDRVDDDVAYIAAKLYLNAERGTTKPAIAKKLSELANVDIQDAMLMLEAIDAYEDIREAPEAWGLQEDMFETTGSDAFVSGYHVGREDCQNGQDDVHMALDAWQKSGRSSR